MGARIWRKRTICAYTSPESRIAWRHAKKSERAAQKAARVTR